MTQPKYFSLGAVLGIFILMLLARLSQEGVYKLAFLRKYRLFTSESPLHFFQNLS